MKTFKNFCLILLFFIGLALFFSDFIAQGTADAREFHSLDEEQKTMGAFFMGYLNLLVPTLLAVLVFSVAGCMDVSEKTRDVVGWGFLVLLAALSAYIGFRRLQQGGADPESINTSLQLRGQIQLGICAFYALLGVAMTLKSMVSSPPQAQH